MVRLRFLFLLLGLYCGTNGFAKVKDCKSLPVTFKSYQHALNSIRAAKFAYQQEYTAFSSSWISGLSYYSCDIKSGFLIVFTKKGAVFIHRDVPKSLWNGIKQANSKGSFYSSNIRGKYRI